MKKKKILLLSACVFVVAVLAVTLTALTLNGRADAEEEKPKLSEMSEEEIARFLEEMEVTVPEALVRFLEEMEVEIEDHVNLVNLMKLIEESPDSFGRLSSLGEEECTEILFELGVVIPESIEGQINVFGLVEYIEANPERSWYYNDPDADKLAQDIRSAMMRYYGLTNQSESQFVNYGIGRLYKEASEAVKQYYGWDA